MAIEGSALQPQFIQIDTLGVSTIETAFPSAQQSLGTVARVRDVNAFYQVTQVGAIGTAHQWSPIGGSSGTFGKYFVAPAGFVAPIGAYTSVQAAINAAATDLHIDGSATSVVIFPGVYDENISLLPGINLMGLSDTNRFVNSVIIRGFGVAGGARVAVSLPGGVNVSFITFGIAVASNGTAFAITAALHEVNLSFFRCEFFGDGVSPAFLDFSGAAAGTDTVIFTDCLLSNNNSIAAVKRDTSGNGTLQFDRCTIRSVTGGTSGIAVWSKDNATNVTITRCEVTGKLQSTGTGANVWTVRNSKFTATGVSLTNLSGSGSDTMSIDLCEINCNTDPIFTGIAGAQITCGTLNMPGTATTFSSVVTIFNATVQYASDELNLTGAGPHSLAGTVLTSLVTVDTAGGAIVLTLPTVANIRPGTRIAIKKVTSAAGTVAVTAAGGNTIDSAANFSLAAGSLTGIIIQASNGVDWRILSKI